MDDTLTTHPPKDRLRAFGLGQLDSAEAEEVAEHLDRCRDCSETMAGLEDDTFVSLVRKSPGPLADQQAEIQATIDSQSGVTGEANTLAELPPELRRHPRYEIVELIGRGGMGDVYKAQHKVMNRTVALKVIRPELVRNAAAVDRFRREVQAAARLHHANIVTAHDAEQAGNLHFLVMEFVDGVDLSQVVRDRGFLPVSEACDYIRQAAIGLEHARQLGMVHRDIKPHNLMLTGNEEIKILDFGLANFASEVVADQALDDAASDSRGTPRSHQQLTQLGTMMGTPDYIAPEQAADARTADIRSDIYSLGCTLTFLLTAKPLFETGSITDKLKAHAEQPPPKLTDTRRDIPPELQQIVDRMLAKSPADRFQTPAEVANALADFVDRHRTDGGGRGRGSGDGLPATSDPMRFGQRLVAMTGVLTLIAALMAIGNRGWITFQYPEWLAPWLTIGGMVSLPFGVAAIITSLQMLRRRWYGFVMATVGLLLLPLNPAQIAMLPLTVWLLRHLRRPDIRAEFDADGLYPLPSYSAPPAGGRRLCLGLSALIGAGLLGVIIHFDTDHGDLTIELNDPSLTVRIERDGRVMRLLENGDTRVTFLPSGQYDITVPGAEDQVTITPNRVAIFRGAKKFVTILREPATLQQTDHDQIQGMWIAESGQRNGEPTPLDKIDMQRMFFDGDKLYVEGPGGKQGDGHFQLTETTSPKRIGVSVTADTRGLRGIYKLEGNRLTICLDKDQSADVPKTFDAPARTTLDLIVLRRAAAITGDLPAGAMSETVTTGYNGSFEVTKSGLPVGWSFYTPRTVPNGDFDIVMDRTDFKEGEQSLKFVVRKCESTGGRLSPGFFTDFRIANFTPPGAFESRPGETYRISFWAKNTGSEFVFKARGVSAKEGDPGVVIRSKETINAWRQFECTYTIPPKMWLRLELNVVQPGTFWIDHLQIVRVNDKAPATPSGSDEARLQGKWVPTGAIMGGKTVLREQLGFFAFEFDGDRAKIPSGNPGQPLAVKFKIDSSNDPAHIDFLNPDPAAKTPLTHGIYKLDGDRLRMTLIDGDQPRPAEWAIIPPPPSLMVLNLTRGPTDYSAERDAESKKLATAAALEWLKLLDAGDYGACWDTMAAASKGLLTREQAITASEKNIKPLGKAESRAVRSVEITGPTNDKQSELVVVTFDTRFADGGSQRERISLIRDADEQWRVAGHGVTPVPPAANQGTPTRTGLLTNPPNLPHNGLPVGRNRIDDPSLEETATGHSPQGWFAWLNDGPDFKCEVSVSVFQALLHRKAID